jgi:hypothetical protein
MSIYRRTGKNAMYIPTTGGTPPSSEYAIPRRGKKKGIHTPIHMNKLEIFNNEIQACYLKLHFKLPFYCQFQMFKLLKTRPTRFTITIKKNFNSSITLNPTCFKILLFNYYYYYYYYLTIKLFLIVIVHLVGLVFNIYKMHGENNIKFKLLHNS